MECLQEPAYETREQLAETSSRALRAELEHLIAAGSTYRLTGAS